MAWTRFVPSAGRLRARITPGGIFLSLAVTRLFREGKSKRWVEIFLDQEQNTIGLQVVKSKTQDSRIMSAWGLVACASAIRTIKEWDVGDSEWHPCHIDNDMIVIDLKTKNDKA